MFGILKKRGFKMAIEKNTKNTLAHEEPSYTVLLNEVVQNIHHTGALGMYCYLASKPADWDICKKNLQNHFECGREHVNACFKYLRKIGAIEVSMIRNEKGQVVEWETVLKRRLSPEVDEINQNPGNPESGSSRIRETQNTGFPESGFPAPTNKRYIQIKENLQIKENINNKTLVDFDKSPSEFDDDEFEMYAGTFEYHGEAFEGYSNLVDDYVGFDEEDITTLKTLDSEISADSNNSLAVKQEEVVRAADAVNQDTEVLARRETSTGPEDKCLIISKPKPSRNSNTSYGLKNIQEDNVFFLPLQAILDWMITRKKKRAPVTRTAWNKINKELAKCQEQGIDPIDAFETMVASGWQSLKVEYFQNQKKPPTFRWDIESVMRA